MWRTVHDISRFPLPVVCVWAHSFTRRLIGRAAVTSRMEPSPATASTQHALFPLCLCTVSLFPVSSPFVLSLLFFSPLLFLSSSLSLFLSAFLLPSASFLVISDRTMVDSKKQQITAKRHTPSGAVMSVMHLTAEPVMRSRESSRRQVILKQYAALCMSHYCHVICPTRRYICVFTIP